MKFNEKKIDFNKKIADAIMSGEKKYVCFGAGSYFHSFIKTYCMGERKFPYPVFVCDNQWKKYAGGGICGVEVKEPSAMLNVDLENTVIAMSTNLPIGILDELFEKYQRHYHMVILLKQIDTYFFIQDHGDELDLVYHLFEDEQSRETYKEYLESLLAGNFFCPIHYTPNPYWNNDLVPRLEGRGVVYAGAFDGKHVDRALKANSDSVIYAFEPNRTMYEKLLVKYQDKEHVHIYPYALFDKKCLLKFDPSYALGAMVVDEELEKDRQKGCLEFVEADQMDHLLSGKEVDLIALDVEGTEKCALKGAVEIIRKNRPQLGICVYHKLQDYYELPLFIKELNPDYKLYFRHHSPAAIESVVYAL